MSNHEALKQLPLSNFANLIFDIVKNQCVGLADFEEILKRDFPEDGRGALQKLQNPISC